MNSSVPNGSFKSGLSHYVCRSPYRGGVHIGKVENKKCSFGWGGKEITQGNFEVLKKDSKYSWSTNKNAGNAIIGGNGTVEHYLKICRTTHNSRKYPGKVVKGKCNIGVGGKEIVKSTYEVLIKK